MTYNKEKRREYNHKWYEKNSQKWNECRRKQHKENPEKYREAGLKHRYDITLEEWNKLFVSQGSKCAICEAMKPGGRGYWHTDHIHGTKIIRGILCHRCNVMLYKSVTSDLLQQ